MRKFALLALLLIALPAAAQPPAPTPPQAPPIVAAEPALIRLTVPDGAEVWLDGHLTASQGTTREYRTPPLVAGAYVVRVRHAGREKTQEIHVHGGHTAQARFEFAEGVSLKAVPFGQSDRPAVDAESPAAGPWPASVEKPKGLAPFVRARFTQRLAKTSSDGGRTFPSTITPADRSRLDPQWHQSGGMQGLTGWRSDVYRFVPQEPHTRMDAVGVVNQFGYVQHELGWVRDYPNGTRFDDVLSNTATGKVFEHRTAQKKNGAWTRRVIFSDETQRPAGYSGLAVTCSSCHDQAGTGGYATALVPGGDTILSDPFPALER